MSEHTTQAKAKLMHKLSIVSSCGWKRKNVKYIVQHVLCDV
jgi:hypothetical protein